MKPLSRLKGAISATGRLAPILRSGLIAGVVVAAVTYPLAAVGGLGLKAGADFYDSLPAELKSLPPAQTSYVYASDGKTLLTNFYEEHRKYSPIADVSENIRKAIVASEDGRFYEHNGVDAKGIARAFVANHTAGEVSQGASTLTMQYVRMALRDGAQTPSEVMAATEQTPLRKIREARLAIKVEKELSKTDILERYLNVAYFGHRAYGVFAAAQIFFSKLPKDLTLAESATLAGLVKAPTAYDPAGSDQTAATQRRNYVIDRMAELGYITPEVAATTKKEPIKLKITEPPNDCIAVAKQNNSWGFFCDMFKNWWLSQPAFGANPGEREDNLRRGGYKITTSLDPKVQDIAMDHVTKRQPIGSAYALGEVVVQPGTGLVKAMAVNRTYSLDQDGNGAHTDPKRYGKVKGNYPNTVNPLLGGGNLPGYQAGSTFKIFTMVAALDAGMKMNTWFYAPHRYKSQYFAGWGERGSCGGGHWCPSNASGSMTGNHAMWSGFGKSVNTYFVQLEQKVGADKAVRMAERLGLKWRTDIDQLQASPGKSKTWGSFTLGVADTTPLEMANAYATMAADGKFCEALPVTGIIKPDGTPAMMDVKGKQVPVATPRCRQEVSKDVARAATDAMRCVTGYGAAKGGCGGWSTAPGVYGMVDRPVAGKTGTTDDTRAAWFVGFTKELAAAAFMADPDNPFHATGDYNAWKPIETVAYTLKDSLKGKDVQQFTPPSDNILGKKPANLPKMKKKKKN
ncbi:transglycosylase domain-containing protein [Catellatospora chokoriensis]|uniref:Carboxypeptidase n=1 Tax=Catellatospora chokoriensis TaxID=310353 RepID=A0A8J3NV18_9ACTN|nr:transglycosylase domain-containing protein [Catellatospora chokoriensis]GIF93478.1 carboxypeptidase [Catellatospora chokoriensis]